jgi:stage II sporulation protein AA (anti-sigma F factor antagonist)
MRITGEKLGSVMVIALSGRMDCHTSPAVHNELIGHIHRAQRRLVLDLSETAYVSSAGLRVLLNVAKQIDQDGGKLVLCALGDTVREVFKISAFDRILSICAARDEAVTLAAE